jgi:t-SNARE complex subunit (syntaxin)
LLACSVARTALARSRARPQERAADAAEIVQGARELKEVYDDLGVLVKQQSEQLDVVVANTEGAKSSVKGGNEHLEDATELQKAIRKKWCFIFLVLVLVLGAICAPIIVSVK